MRNAQNLERGSKRVKLASDDVRDTAADSRVHLVEDEARRAGSRRAVVCPIAVLTTEPRQTGAEGQRLDRQHDSRQLAARRGARQRAERLAWVRGQKEF